MTGKTNGRSKIKKPTEANTGKTNANVGDLRVEYRPLSSLAPYARNARTHSEDQVAQIAASMQEFGWTNPVLVDSAGGIIAGHGRVLAAQKLGIQKAPCITLANLTEVQKRAYIIADNKLALNAGWDEELLKLELLELQDLDFDIDLLGFDDEEFNSIVGATDGLTDPDDMPQPPATPVTVAGDLWILGRHRLLCGDSGSPVDVDRLLAGAPVHLVNTDPPYNVKVEPRSNNAIAAGNSSFTNTHHQSFDAARDPRHLNPTTTQMRPKDRPLINDFVSEEEFAALLQAWFGNISRVLLHGRGFYIWGGYANCANYPPALKAAKLYFSQSIIWVKQHPVLTRKDFMGDHEWCFYGWREGAAHAFLGPNNATDVWAVKKVNPQSMVHLTEKPVELAVRAIQYSSHPGEHVLDLFGGSGSTLIAAEQTNRRSFLMEMDPAYCDVIIQRWQEFTGQKASHEGGGSFKEVKSARLENVATEEMGSETPGQVLEEGIEASTLKEGHV